jgi:hypothetical protein
MKRVHNVGGIQIVWLPRAGSPKWKKQVTIDGHTWLWMNRLLMTDCTCADLTKI